MVAAGGRSSQLCSRPTPPCRARGPRSLCGRQHIPKRHASAKCQAGRPPAAPHPTGHTPTGTRSPAPYLEILECCARMRHEHGNIEQACHGRGFDRCRFGPRRDAASFMAAPTHELVLATGD
eukprot:95290-Chlamydomonas_euryale.AAC.1